MLPNDSTSNIREWLSTSVSGIHQKFSSDSLTMKDLQQIGTTMPFANKHIVLDFIKVLQRNQDILELSAALNEYHKALGAGELSMDSWTLASLNEKSNLATKLVPIMEAFGTISENKHLSSVELIALRKTLQNAPEIIRQAVAVDDFHPTEKRAEDAPMLILRIHDMINPDYRIVMAQYASILATKIDKMLSTKIGSPD